VDYIHAENSNIGTTSSAPGDESIGGDPGSALVLFDGMCNACDAAVLFIIDRDPRGYFAFASLQSEAARRHLAPFRRAPDLSSMLVIERGRLFSESAAVIRIALRLRGPARLAALAWFIPLPVRDLLYRFFGRNRYRWFGSRTECRVPGPELQRRFLS
jgi:predicted DCC family thiol-disulfide oxidoreductase YuxK